MGADIRRLLFRTEAHRGDIESIPMSKSAWIRFHDLNRRLDRIRHVNHVKVGIAAEKARIVLIPDRFVVDLHRIIGSSATWRRQAADDAGEANPSGIDIPAVVVIITEQFSGHLGNSIDRGRPLNRVLRGEFLWGCRSERADRRGNKDGARPLPGDLQDSDEAVDIEIPRFQRILLGAGGEKGGQMVDRIDPMSAYDLIDSFTVAGI
ncbi:MAG: hypothetical protein BWY50_02148 [Spirochaetes bacterium ADurb.Bin315]|nr:MAG: hypothetical protein BWY50_02148 [Spirochaetes bacterium ADurb.Bin315]